MGKEIKNAVSQKSGWGGRRAGAGRKKTSEGVRTVAVRVPQDVSDVLDTVPSITEYVVTALRAYIARSAAADAAVEPDGGDGCGDCE